MQNFKEFKRARETFELLWFRRFFKGNEVTKTVPQMNDAYSLTNLEEAWSVFCFIITTTIVPFRKDTQKKKDSSELQVISCFKRKRAGVF